MPDLIIPATVTTELEAVNAIIAAIGEAPVAIIDPSPSTDVDKALLALSAANRKLQTRGWKWNKEFAYPLVPAADGTVSLPYNTLDCIRSYIPPVGTTGSNQPTNIVARGLALYDMTNHTYVFDTTLTIYADLILILEWAQLPEQARRVITLEAARTFLGDENLSGTGLQVTASNLRDAWAMLEQKEDREEAPNALYGNRDTALKVMGTGSMRRNRVNG